MVPLTWQNSLCAAEEGCLCVCACVRGGRCHGLQHTLVFQIPSSAVEMPGSADVPGLNVQFGALEFGLEPPLSEFGSAASYESNSQTPNTVLYPKTVK